MLYCHQFLTITAQKVIDTSEYFFLKNWKTGSYGENLEKKKVNFIVDEYDGETLSNDETIKTMIVIMMLMKKHIHMKKTENCMFCMS